MKTNFKNSFWIVILLLGLAKQFSVAQSISGIVKDKTTGNPLPFATIKIIGTSEGTVCNYEGAFQLETPTEQVEVEVMFVGYKTITRKVSVNQQEVFELEEDPKILQEVTVSGNSQSAYELIQEALGKISENYHEQNLNANAFYRELIKMDLNDLQIEDSTFQFTPSSGKKISEALLTSYVPGHSKKKLKSHTDYSLKNGRNLNTLISTDSEMDSIVNEAMENFKLKGGVDGLKASTVKSLKKSDFLTDDDLYDYKVKGLVSFNGRPAYEIIISPKSAKKILLHGKVYVDEKTLAIVYLESAYSPSHLEHAFRIKLLGVEAQFTEEAKKFIYEYTDNGWVLKYANLDFGVSLKINRKVRKKSRSIDTHIYTRLELLHSKYSSSDVQPIPKDQLFKKKNQISQKFTQSYDPKLWENHTIIPLDTDIVKELNK